MPIAMKLDLAQARELLIACQARLRVLGRWTTDRAGRTGRTEEQVILADFVDGLAQEINRELSLADPDERTVVSTVEDRPVPRGGHSGPPNADPGL